ncbi:MAG: helix-turn-helix domain-containing protein [Acidimicrobiia bacterium]|nr:helix-turn-helix domain-containing protein [Acidimicrobiia bacterium]
MHEDWWDQHLKRVGAFIKEQRRLSELSQREFARMVNLSDTYMSQLERGMHEPSIRVLRAIAEGLNLSADQLIAFVAGLAGQPSTGDHPSTEDAIRADPRLDLGQKQALLSVLRSYVAASSSAPGATSTPRDEGPTAG